MDELSDEKASQVYITKFGAAERLMNSAILMHLREEDDLSIHTLAASSYRILRDMKAQRGHSDALEPWRRGIFYMVRDLATGKSTEIPSSLLKNPWPRCRNSDSLFLLRFGGGLHAGQISGSRRAVFRHLA